MADEEEVPADPAQEPPAKGSSPLSFIIAMVILTVLAAGAGGMFGAVMLPKPSTATEHKAEAPVQEHKRMTGGANLKTLAPIVTNLAGAKSTWIRLEASVVFEGDALAETDLIAGKIGEDVLAFLRTVSLADIEGPSGFQNLREDLNDRVRIRSGGKARELVIQALIVE